MYESEVNGDLKFSNSRRQRKQTEVRNIDPGLSKTEQPVDTNI